MKIIIMKYIFILKLQLFYFLTSIYELSHKGLALLVT